MNNTHTAMLALFTCVALLLATADTALSDQSAQISSRNSTTSLLGSGETFTGVSDDVSAFSQINCFAYSDVTSAVNGWSLELSTDGTNWDRKKQLTLSAAASQAHTLVSVTRFFRVIYINGASAQSEFRLQCTYKLTQSKDLTSSITETINGSNDVTLVRQTGDHSMDVARGLISDHELIRKFGHNDVVGAAEEAVWSTGGDYTGFLTSATNIEVLSDSIDDDTDGAGANNGASSVIVYGLDENFDSVIETITLDGTTVDVHFSMHIVPNVATPAVP